MITIHHLGVSQSERVIWLMEELGLPYELKLYKRNPGMAPPEYRALHPMGIAPVIDDGNVRLGESSAIVDYILAKYGDGRFVVDEDASNFADYLYWLVFANTTLLPSDMGRMLASMMSAEDKSRLQFLDERSDRAYSYIEQRLGEVPYFAGPEFTAADLMMVFPLTTMRMFAPKDLSGFPNILAFLQRIGARPAYQRAMAKGDPGMTPMLS